MTSNRSSVVVFAALVIASLACGPAAATPTASAPPLTATPPPPTPTPVPDATLLPLDDTWNEYVNHRLGFSMRVPRTMYHPMGDCVWRGEQGDPSYRPLMAEVPVAVFEDVDRVYLAAASYAELIQPTQEPHGAGYHTLFAGCDHIINTLDRARAQEGTSNFWEIVVREAHGPADLEALVDEVYGEACQVGETREAEQPDVLWVRVLGDGLPPEQSACWLNYMYVFLYAPARGLAATWITGQSIHFISNPDTFDGYDTEMLESFRFLP